jgi:hypothetical protein
MTFVLARLLVWGHVGVPLHWLIVFVGAVLTAWLWRAFFATYRIDKSFGDRGTLSTLVMIPLILGIVMTVGDALKAAKETS